MAHPGGRPLKFRSVKELQAKIDAYFADCDPHMVELKEWVQARDTKGNLKKNSHGMNYLVQVEHKKMTDQVPYTITGLAMALDTSRETLLDYEEKAQFSDTIKRAKIRCQNYAEQNLFTTTPTGSIFNLKNNYGWQEKTELEHSGKIDRNISEEELNAIIERERRTADKAGQSS